MTPDIDAWDRAGFDWCRICLRVFGTAVELKRDEATHLAASLRAVRAADPQSRSAAVDTYDLGCEAFRRRWYPDAAYLHVTDRGDVYIGAIGTNGRRDLVMRLDVPEQVTA